MNILYLGHFFPQRLIENINSDSKGKIGFSNHNFEMSILTGLSKQQNLNVSAITIPSVFSFPYNNRKLFTPREKFTYKGINVKSLGFCNLPVIKEYLGILLGAFQIIKEFKKYPKSTINIIINTPSKRWLNAIRIARLFTKRKLTQTVIVPDIPALVSSMDATNPIKRRILYHQNQSIMVQTSHCDGLVVLTGAMMNWFSPRPPHIVMEGIIATDKVDIYNSEIPNENTKEIILYSGTLRRIFGVMNLVKAFNLIPDMDVELWICGSGEAAEEIEHLSKQDSRIKFFGLVDSAKAIDLQHKATILVNPRTSEGEFTKYSFPSKTMEYLLAGKSVIINRLPGIPQEYYDYVFTPKDESVGALAECIIEVMKMNPDIRCRKSHEGQNFVMSHKNAIVQTMRIIELIKTYN